MPKHVSILDNKIYSLKIQLLLAVHLLICLFMHRKCMSHPKVKIKKLRNIKFIITRVFFWRCPYISYIILLAYDRVARGCLIFILFVVHRVLYIRNLGNTTGTAIPRLSVCESWDIICGWASIFMCHNATVSIIYNKYSVRAEG